MEVSANPLTQPQKYLASRARVACDRLGNGRRSIEWTLQDVTVVERLPANRPLHVEYTLMRKYETLDRAIALRDGLL